MQTLGVYLLFFGVGVVQDLLITYYYQMITKEFAWRSAILSTTITLVNIFVLYEILNNLDQQVASVILAYAVGNGVGTFFIVKKHAIANLFRRRK